MSADDLVIEFLGEEYPVARGDTLAFGRSAELTMLSARLPPPPPSPPEP